MSKRVADLPKRIRARVLQIKSRKSKKIASLR